MKRRKKTATAELSNVESNGAHTGYIRQAFRWFNEAFSPADEEGPKLSKAEMKRMIIRIAIIFVIMTGVALLMNCCASSERWIRL